MSDVTPEQAIDIMARHAIHAAIPTGDFSIEMEWGNYPEIGEYDWDKIVARIEALVTPPADDDWHAAYALLEARADPDAENHP